MGTELHPYLNFDGRTAEAMAFYADVFGGDLDIMRFSDSPMPHAPEHGDRVMHASLRNGTLTLMASDTRPGEAADYGNAVHLSLNFASPEEQTAAWDRLAEGATITMPLEQQFFGRFGALTDRFGVSWMFHHAPAQG